MDNERKNVPLVNRKDFLRENHENDSEIKFFENKRIREEKRRMRLEKERSNRIIAISIAFTLAVSTLGASFYLKKAGGEISGQEAISRTEERMNDDQFSGFDPENLVFDAVVHDVESGETYRVVVASDGKHSAFVNENYEAPFHFLNGVSSEEAARNLGFDFEDYKKGRSK